MWLDLTADGDVFVPDRRFGRSRRLIDGFSPPFACVAPDHALSLFRSSFSFSLLVPSRLVSSRLRARLRSLVSSRFSRFSRHLASLFLLLPPSSFLHLRTRFSSHSQSVSPAFGEGTSRPAVHRSCFCRAAYK